MQYSKLKDLYGEKDTVVFNNENINKSELEKSYIASVAFLYVSGEDSGKRTRVVII